MTNGARNVKSAAYGHAGGVAVRSGRGLVWLGSLPQGAHGEAAAGDGAESDLSPEQD